MTTGSARPRRTTVLWLILAGVLAALLMAGVASYYASPHPDGLEYVAEEQGFLDTAADSATATSPLADYGVEGVADERTSVGLAGLAGVGLTALLGFGLFLLLRARRSPAGESGG